MTAPVDLAGSATPLMSRRDVSRNENPSIEEVAQEFESLFLAQLLSALRGDPDGEGFFEGNTGQEIYTSMMDQALARALAAKGGIGLARPISDHLQRIERPPAASAVAEPTIGPQGDPAKASHREDGGGAKNFDSSPLAAVLSGAVGSVFRISSRPGWRNDPFSGKLQHHKGIDLAAPIGTEVSSLTRGRVVFAGAQGGYGNTIVVESADGLRVRYAHLGEILVKPGEKLEKGQNIGLVGSTGRSTGPHLHIEWEKAGRLLDSFS
ncbi:MAG: peptidoglycan DD-metalloendopeptidase family protein [Acidobacteriota bacterium]